MKTHLEKIATNQSFDQANDGFSQIIIWAMAGLFIWWAVSLMSQPLDDTFSKPVHLFQSANEPATLTILGWRIIR